MRMRRVTVGLVASVALVVGCGWDDEASDDGYSDATEAAFLEPCVAGLGEEERDVCECSYERMVDEIPFDTFRDLDRRLQDDPDADLPDEVADIVAACAAEEPTTTAET